MSNVILLDPSDNIRPNRVQDYIQPKYLNIEVILSADIGTGTGALAIMIILIEDMEDMADMADAEDVEDAHHVWLVPHVRLAQHAQHAHHADHFADHSVHIDLSKIMI